MCREGGRGPCRGREHQVWGMCRTVAKCYNMVVLQGADVRSVMDGLISGGGPMEVVLGEGGQPATTGTMDEDEEGELGAPAGRKAGAAGEAGAERPWGGTMMAGADVGLDSLEYVPLSLSKVWETSVVNMCGFIHGGGRIQGPCPSSFLSPSLVIP